MEVPMNGPKAFDWIRPGVPCWYSPSPAESRPYAAVVGSELQEDSGELCVRLVDLDERYTRARGRSMVGRAPWYTLKKRRAQNGDQKV
jgi:hypothetical protein